MKIEQSFINGFIKAAQEKQGLDLNFLSNPIVQQSLLGAGIGGLATGIFSKKNKLRNGLAGALAGGLGGAAYGYFNQPTQANQPESNQQKSEDPKELVARLNHDIEKRLFERLGRPFSLNPFPYKANRDLVNLLRPGPTIHNEGYPLYDPTIEPAQFENLLRQANLMK